MVSATRINKGIPMSQELTSIRRTLTRVSSDLKQNKLLPVANAVQAATRAMIRMSLLKNEQEELSRMIFDACDMLQNNNELRKIFPLAITYVPKEEAQLLETLNELIAILQAEASAQAKDGMQALLERQRSQLEKGQAQLDAEEHDAARATFKGLSDEFAEDGEVITEIGEKFLQAGLLEDAAHYLQGASNILPGSAHVLNRLGIALRRIGRFDAAEDKFQRALEIEKNDPNLYFNLGRLYLDTKRWADCVTCANEALQLEPSFTQATQMVAYCNKMLKAAD